MRREHRWLLLALLLAAAHQAVFIGWTSDDAFISYRYAENWSAGKGLVFNAGEKTEGFSNFLWVLILALFNRLGFPSLVVSKALSFAASLILVVLMFKKAEAWGRSRFASAAPALSLAFSASLAYFSMSGLETVFYACLLFLAVFLHERYEVKPSPGTFSALYGILLAASLTRPEGIMFFGLSAAHHIVEKIVSKKGISLGKMLTAWAGAAAVVSVFLVLRYNYYSAWLPNTFYAKPKGTFAEGTGSALLSNIANSFFVGAFLLVLLIPALSRISFLKKNSYPLLFVAGQIVFMSYAGDWMALGRFFFPVLPIVLDLDFKFLGSLETSARSPSRARFMKSLPAWLSLVFAVSNLFQTAAARRNVDLYPFLVMESSALKECGKYLKREFPAGTLIATRRQGAVPYYSGMDSVDILGLTDRDIALNIYLSGGDSSSDSLNADYILSREPGVIVLFSSTVRDGGMLYDKNEPGDKLLSFEFLLFERAIEAGYSLRERLPTGKNEKALILIRG